jgi:hypothetical protein
MALRIAQTQSNATANDVLISLMLPYRKIPRLPVKEFKSLKVDHHKATKELIRKHCYKPGLSATLHELVNCANKEGITRVTRETLALRLNVTVRTIGRQLDRLEEHGHIIRNKMGWKHSNSTQLLYLHSKTELNHKEDKMSSYHTSPSPLRRGEREREPDSCKREKEKVSTIKAPLWLARKKADEQAQEQLNQAKVSYPIRENFSSNQDHYDAVCLYNSQRSTVAVQILNDRHSKPISKKEVRPDWHSKYD